MFEMENGKPKLILVNPAERVQKNTVKPRPRLPSVLNCRPPSRVETQTPRTQEQPIRKHNVLNGRSHQSKPGRGAVTISKTQENHVPGKEVKTNAKVKASKPQNVRSNRKPEDPKKKVGQKVLPSNQCTELQDSEACLTNEQLQQILDVLPAKSNYPPITEEIQAETVSESVSRETKEPEELRGETGTVNFANKHKRSGGLLSWVEERPSEDRAALEAKKAQWKKELDEQVALKQKIHRSAPPRLQVEDDTESLVSVQSSISYKDLPAAIRSSLRVGEFAPMDEAELTQEQRQEQRRQWLQELDKQRDETTERKRLEKLLQQQSEDLQLWASHFDSLQRPPLAPPLCPLTQPVAPPPCPSADRAETGLSSSLSQWEDASVRASVETSSSSGGGHTTRASHLRTMTSLLDPAEIEQRERRRLKQLEQQRAIELQVEERRRHREEEENRRKREEEEEERRVEKERARLQQQYERDTQRERNKELSSVTEIINGSEPEPQSNTVANQDESPEPEAGPAAVNHHRDTGVQTDEMQMDPDSSAEAPAQVPGPSVLDRAQVLQMLQMLRKGFGTDVYEPFARTERSKKDEKRPDWNTQKPSRRFVPASQRYPEELQRQRQENRLRRQAQLLSLQRNPPQTPATQTTPTKAQRAAQTCKHKSTPQSQS
ncbi:hypothetical protein WMY93_020273 [Mugilogobius chulae]|uniref:CCDC66 domain-containing protein n=1 Tax=Mugilogobius chulae TaxID=88201 RepID=A0AAW0NLJ9_9GOBI